MTTGNTSTHQQTMINWMETCQITIQQQSIIPPPPPDKKEERPVESLSGGWEAEGKDRPVKIFICTKCQWVKADNQKEEEPDKDGWCESCINGRPPPGQELEGYRLLVGSKLDDVRKLNQTFFG